MLHFIDWSGADTALNFNKWIYTNNIQVACFKLTIANGGSNLYTLTTSLGFTQTPTCACVMTKNNVNIDAVYSALVGQVKMCAYATSQQIQYYPLSDIFPTFTNESLVLSSKRFASGIGDKETYVMVAVM